MIKWSCLALFYSISRWYLFRLRPMREEMLKQIESAGIRSLGLVGVIGILSGAVIIDQSVGMVGAAGEIPVKLLSWTLFGEAGALAVGFLVAARVAPAMAADLALMRFRGELGHLAAIDISAADYLVVPRVIPLILVSALLAIYFMASALLGGMLVASFMRDFAFLPQLARFFEIMNPLSMLIAILKCSLFGGVVALVSCYHGLAIERDAKSLAQAGSEAFTGSLLALGLLDVGTVLLSALIE
ncbi:MAG: hypothetical protein A2Z95_03480 [Gallionellales bacterium GWA2_60_18]|nr:MAG: hypothetical protein A2Z95_03480 [Gallionellales bacterium GWA2_60_18]